MYYLKRFCLLISIWLFPLSCYGLYEIGGSFGYSKQVYGNARQNSMVSRSYTGTAACYLLNLTGLELNYAQTEDIITENDAIALGAGITVNSIQNKVLTKMMGVGLRQVLFANEYSFVMPILSLGYAKQVKTGGTDYTVDDNGQARILSFSGAKQRIDSAFGTFTLKFNLTRGLSVNGSVKTVFKAFEYNEAKNNLSYEAGFSWMF